MNKFIILFASSCLLSGHAEAKKNTCAIETISQGHNRISFFLSQPLNTVKTYFYVNTHTDNRNTENSLASILVGGKPLTHVPNSQPTAYQVSEDAKVLNIFVSKNRIEELGSLTEITPNLKSTLNPSRNVNNYPALLPPETTQLANGDDVSICRLKL